MASSQSGLGGDRDRAIHVSSRTEAFAERLRSQPCFGTFLKLGRPEVADILALAGFDFVICDMEHAQMTEREARDVIRACATNDLPVLVRLPEPSQGVVNRLLEAGAIGIQMPRLRTAAEAEHLFAMMHFPPQGERSVGNANQLARYGQLPISEYLLEADRRMVVVGQFETRQIDDPCDPMFERLDVAFIGPTDLSVDFGRPGHPDEPPVGERITQLEQVAARHGTAMGIATKDLEATKHFLARGYRYLAVSGDVALLVESAKRLASQLRGALDELRAAVEAPA